MMNTFFKEFSELRTKYMYVTSLLRWSKKNSENLYTTVRATIMFVTVDIWLSINLNYVIM